MKLEFIDKAYEEQSGPIAYARTGAKTVILWTDAFEYGGYSVATPPEIQILNIIRAISSNLKIDTVQTQWWLFVDTFKASIDLKIDSDKQILSVIVKTYMPVPWQPQDFAGCQPEDYKLDFDDLTVWEKKDVYLVATPENIGGFFCFRKDRKDPKTEVVFVEKDKFLELWEQSSKINHIAFIPVNLEKAEMFGSFMRQQNLFNTMEMPFISFYDGVVGFTNGRHRTSNTFAFGGKIMPVQISSDEAQKLKKICGYNSGQSKISLNNIGQRGLQPDI